MLNMISKIWIGSLCLFSCSFLHAETFSLENKNIKRTLSTDGALVTTEIINKRAGKKLIPTECVEFALRISKGTDKVGTDEVLTSKDFHVVKVARHSASEAVVELSNKDHGLKVTVNYTLNGLIAYCSEFTNGGIQYLILYGFRRTVTFTEFHR